MDSVTDYNRLRDKILLSCCGLMYCIVLVCYALEWLKGARTLQYFLCIFCVTALPFVLLVYFFISNKKENKYFKYLCTFHFLVFYAFSLHTTQVESAWGYIVPLLSIAAMYFDWVLTISLSIISIIINIAYFFILSNRGTPLGVAEIEQRLGALVLSGVFISCASYIIRGYYNMLTKILSSTSIDRVTGLFFLDGVKTVWNRTINETRKLRSTFMVVDVDDFLYYVDNFGVEFSNKVLKLIADCVTDIADSYSSVTVCRMSTDGFGILLEGRSRNEVYSIAKAIVERVNCIILSPGVDEIVLSVSVGITDTDSCDTKELKELISRAISATTKARAVKGLHIYIDDRTSFRESN